MSATLEHNIETFSESEAEKLFDDTSQRYMKMSGGDFIEQWDRGCFTDPAIRTRAMRVATLIPMVRPTGVPKYR